MNQCSKIQMELASLNAASVTRAYGQPEVRRHLSSCADCRKIADDAGRLASLFSKFPRPALPSSFDAGLQTKLIALRARHEQTSRAARLAAWLKIGDSPLARRASPTASLGASLAAVAIVAGSLLLPLHFGSSSSRGPAPSGGGSASPATIAPLPAALPQEDADFIAACSSQQAQYSSTQSVADPSASALAASLDETRLTSNNRKSGDDTNPAVD